MRITVTCDHLTTEEEGEAPRVHILTAHRDERGEWIDDATGEPLGAPRMAYDPVSGRPWTPPKRGRIALFSCWTCHVDLWSRGRRLAIDLEQLAQAGLERVDLGILVRRASTMR